MNIFNIKSLFVFIFSTLFLIGCNKNPESNSVNDSKNTNPSSNTTYHILIDTQHPPYSFRNDDGEVVGFEIDLLKEIAKKENFEIQFVTSSSEKIFKDLKREEYDAAASGIEVSDKFSNNITDIAQFSDSYISTQTVAIYTTSTIKNSSDIKNKKLGVKQGASYLPFLKRELKGPNTITYYGSSFLSFHSMIIGEVDASIHDIQVALYYINEFNEATLTNPIKIIPILNNSKHNFAFLVANDKTELLKKINKGLKKVKKDGSYEEISARWLK